MAGLVPAIHAFLRLGSSSTAAQVMEILVGTVRASGLAALVATHNLELARRLDRIVALEDGRLRPAA